MSPPDDGQQDGQGRSRDRFRKLEREYERLRRSHRRLRAAVAVPLVSAATSVGTPGELEVSELRVVGEDGTPRMVLTPQISREAVFYGRRIIRNSPDAAGIVFHDGDGMEQGAIAFLDAGGIGMGLDSKTGQNGGLFVSPDGRSMDLSFWTTRGEEHRLSLGIEAGEGPVLEMTRAGEEVVRLPRPEEEGDEGGEGSDE